MVHNISHYLDILIVTFNVHSNAYLSNRAQLILYGIHVLMFAIGLQLLLHLMETAVMDRHPLVAVETAMVHQHRLIALAAAAAVAMVVVHHLILTERRNAQLLNAKNVVIRTEDIPETADILETADTIENEDPVFHPCHSHHFQSVHWTALDHFSKLFDYFLLFQACLWPLLLYLVQLASQVSSEYPVFHLQLEFHHYCKLH